MTTSHQLPTVVDRHLVDFLLGANGRLTSLRRVRILWYNRLAGLGTLLIIATGLHLLRYTTLLDRRVCVESLLDILLVLIMTGRSLKRLVLFQLVVAVLRIAL